MLRFKIEGKQNIEHWRVNSLQVIIERYSIFCFLRCIVKDFLLRGAVIIASFSCEETVTTMFNIDTVSYDMLEIELLDLASINLV